MTAKFGYVTTACRLCEDIVPPDGGDLRCGAIGVPAKSPIQPVLPYVRQRVSKRYRHGSLRWKRPAESHHQLALQPRTANLLAHSRHVSLFQSIPACRQAPDTFPSREAAQLPIQRGICRRLQQIPTREQQKQVHRVQPARDAVASWQEQRSGENAQVFLLHERSPRLRHQQTQQHARQYQVALTA